MTRYHAGDMVMYGPLRGEVTLAVNCGWKNQLCTVQFGRVESWVMADLLRPAVERLTVALRVVGGSDMEVTV